MVNLYHRDWTRQELARYVGHMDQVAGIRLLEGADGVERGSARIAGVDRHRIKL